MLAMRSILFSMRFIRRLMVFAVLCYAAFTFLLPEPRSGQQVISVGEHCPGYQVLRVEQDAHGLTADLKLAGEACNVYGTDVEALRLSVAYDTKSRLHVRIEDAAKRAYQLSEALFPVPEISKSNKPSDSLLELVYQESPFTFQVLRKSSGEVIFDSSAASFIFEDQYVRLRTHLSSDPNIYGLGEHGDHLRLKTTDFTRTLWAVDNWGIPPESNLYGVHPVYYDHRGPNGTHGVFLRSSSGMDIKFDKTPHGKHFLEYNILGGVVDLYLLAGPGPTEVAQQYGEVVGKPAMVPYWSLGFHQCRYGYRDFYAIAESVYNYSAAGIPLETMWTDIDYMYERQIMTNDPDRFPMARIKDYVKYLHDHDQHYIVMVDPAIAYQTERELGKPYETFIRARSDGLLLRKDGSIFQSVVWPGVAAYPDWFHPRTTRFWIDEFGRFFNSDDGFDIDGLWIDMNEPTNFMFFNSKYNAAENAERLGLPPNRAPLRSSPRKIPGFPAVFQPDSDSPYPPDPYPYVPPWVPADRLSDRPPEVLASNPPKDKKESKPARAIIGLAGRKLLSPPYQIRSTFAKGAYGGLSNYSTDTDIVHYDGHAELDVHNLHGSMMNAASRAAMIARRPGRRPFVVTRSTFAGDGRHVAKWLGDNLSTWQHYRKSIYGMLNFAALFQMPMVGSDICGHGGNATENLCARWATLGAFNSFFRNHNGYGSDPQEFYVWDSVARAAKYAINVRYRLLDYLYTALHDQSTTGKPALNTMFFLYPDDPETYGIELQFFYGDSLLISPVTEDDATSVEIYLPDDLFYNFETYRPIHGTGSKITLKNVAFTEIPIHIKSGSIIPMRSSSGMTTKEVRKQSFDLLIAPTADGAAGGRLYLDDGDSLVQDKISNIDMLLSGGTLTVSGTFEYTADGNSVHKITLLGVNKGQFSTMKPEIKRTLGDAWRAIPGSAYTYDLARESVDIIVDISLERAFSIRFRS